MARIVIAAPAADDVDEALSYLTREAGFLVASSFDRRLLSFIERLALYPKSGHPRPRFGQSTRVGVVFPYLVFYRHDASEDLVSIIRVLHGSRRIRKRDLAAS